MYFHDSIRKKGLTLLAAAALFTSATHADIRLELIGEYQSGLFDEAAAEINAYDPTTQQLFVVNANNGLIDVLDLSDPTTPAYLRTLNPGVPNGAEVNSVDVHNGILAAAVAASPKTDPGFAVFYHTNDLDAGPVAVIATGALPDMILFSPDGTKVLTANEGEPNDDYSIDPVGSVTVIDISSGVSNTSPAQTISWSGRDADTLRASGVRIFGPDATVEQDLEPEYIAVSADGSMAYVVFQENNAIGLIDLETMTAGAILPLGTKDHSLPGNGFDASDRDGVINIANWPVTGLYLPDTLKISVIEGTEYLLTANEGDAREYDGFEEESRIKNLTLDPAAFPDAAALQQDALLGRLAVTTTMGDIDGDSDFDELYSFGGRSFSIWKTNGELVWDSGDQFERILAELKPLHFNSNNDENGSFDDRSDAKGPEPEAIEIAQIGGKFYAFIGLERMGGIMTYDVSDPVAPRFVNYTTSRDFTVDAETDVAAARELGPEDIRFVSSAESPNGRDLLIVSSEVSGSITIYEIKPRENFTLTLLHINDPESQLVHAGSLQTDPENAPMTGSSGADSEFVNFGGAARFLTKWNQLRSEATTDAVLTISGGDNFLPGLELDASNPLRNGDNSFGVHYDALTIAAANFDVSAVGNHEFDFGPEYLINWYKQVRTGLTIEGAEVYPRSDVAFVSANLDASAYPELETFIVPSVVLEKGGERIGVIGGTTWYLPDISSVGDVAMKDANSDGFSSIEDVASLVQAEVDRLEADGVNKIFLVTHLQNIRNEQDLVTRIRGVDVVIGGGGNELLANEGNPVIAGRAPLGTYPLLHDRQGNPVLDLDGRNVPVVVCDGDFRYIGMLEMAFNPNGELISFEGQPHRVSAFTPGLVFDGETIVNDGVEEDAFLVAAVRDPVFAFASVQFQTELATSEVTLESRRSATDPVTGLAIGKREAETNLGNLTADAVLYEGRLQAEALNAPVPVIGFQNSGGIRNDGQLPPGSLTLGDVFNYLPFTNYNSIVEGVTPTMLKEIMEHSVSALPDASGAFLQISGFRVVYDPERPAQVSEGGAVSVPGERVRRIELADGTVLVEEGVVLNTLDSLAVATNSFVAQGGDGYFWLAALPRTDAPSLYGDALINYVSQDLEGLITEAAYGFGTVGNRILSTRDYVFDFMNRLDGMPWRHSSWMGWIYTGSAESGWFYHLDLEWIYLSSSNDSPESAWMWIHGSGWHWSSSEADYWPYLWRYSDLNWIRADAF